MRIGVYLSTRPPQPLERMIEQARALEQRGIELLWIGQLYDYEALALAALLGRETQRIALGTWVVPTYPRHPSVLAQQALTAQAASDNRLVLGIGLSHQVVIEKRLGLDFSRPVRHMREYLEVLLPLLRGEPVAHEGQLFPRAALRECPRREGATRASRRTRTADAAAVRARSPTAWRSGWRRRVPRALRARAPARGERRGGASVPAPRRGPPDRGLPRSRGRARDGRAMAGPELRAALVPGRARARRRGGARGHRDPGDEAEVRAQLARLAALGVSDFNAVCMPFPEEPDSLERTHALLAEPCPS